MAEDHVIETEPEVDPDEVTTDTVSSEDERREAGEMGWVDLPKFRGGKDKWITAKEFVERGKHILPIVQENNKRLKAELDQERRARGELEQRVKINEDTMAALEEFYAEETNRRVKETREAVLAQLKAAKTEGDVDAEVALTDQLTKLNAEAAKREADGGGNAKSGADAPAAQVTPEYLQWQAKNADWWGKDNTKTQRAWLIAQELRLDPANATLVGTAFFEKVDELLDERYGEGKGKPAASKVSASRGGGTARSGGSRGLTSEERQACHSFAPRLVGPGRRYKTLGDWEKAYLAQVTAGDQA